jgi:hypothetical protein
MFKVSCAEAPSFFLSFSCVLTIARFTEFVAAGKKMQQIIRLQELRAVFDAMDRDGSGAIDKEELFEAMKKQASADPKTMRELLQRYGDMDHVEQVWRRDVDSVFAKFDEDQNGTINFSGRQCGPGARSIVRLTRACTFRIRSRHRPRQSTRRATHATASRSHFRGGRLVA